MIDVHASKAHVLRAVLLPLDCSRKQLTKLLALHKDTQSGFGERLDEYGVEALKATGDPDQPPVVESLHEIATFSAITALRVEFANPILDTGYYEQYPEHSSERRMMTRPLRKHPGLSRFGEDIRDQYVYDVLYAFKHLAPESVQREVVAALSFKGDQTEAACTPELLATYRALKRVDEGVPFRTAYREAAAGAGEALSPDAILGAYRTLGGPGQERPGAVRARLEAHGDWVPTVPSA